MLMVLALMRSARIIAGLRRVVPVYVSDTETISGPLLSPHAYLFGLWSMVCDQADQLSRRIGDRLLEQAISSSVSGGRANLIRCEGATADWKIERWGPQMTRDGGFDYTGYSIRDLPDPRPVTEGLIADLAAAHAAKTPTVQTVEGTFGEKFLRYRRFALPVGSHLLVHTELQPVGPAVLTSRQRRVAELFAEGHDVVSIARYLDLSPNTVKVHLRDAYQRLNIRTKSALPAALNGAVP